MFSELADGSGLRRLVWTSRIGTMLLVAVMLVPFIPFVMYTTAGTLAAYEIVLVVPALIIGTRLLRQGRLVGAVVTLIAMSPYAALGVTVPEGHAYTAPVAGIGGMLFVLCCAVAGLTTEEMIRRPDRWHDGRAGVAFALPASICLASTVTFVLAMVLGRDLAH